MELDYTERIMKITYTVGDDIRTFAGWAMRSTKDTETVIVRKVGGRNRWHGMNLDQILDIEPA